ncbi:MAG: electron transport complex subunit RsxD [Pseudomonadota bacterium]|nr:MAG: electron transport complex subunit RsxD [Pseudomonadota bacterium]
MKFEQVPSSPHLAGATSITRVMLTVVAALVPGIAAWVLFFGAGVVVNLVIAVLTALAAETLMLRMRGRPLLPFLSDGSAVVTAMLLALALPPLAPWWLVFLGTAFAMVVAKHLYGGLGYNPFNPAMAGYAMLLIAFPLEMTAWLPPAAPGDADLTVADHLRYAFTGALPGGASWDALTMATPLDTVKTELGAFQTVGEITAASPHLFGSFAGAGWEWVNLMFLAGGLWLIYKRVITWHIPVAFLGALTLMATLFYLGDPGRFPSPLFHLFSGAAILGAFFIATDPVSGATTLRGRLIFGAGIGVLVYLIRTWGGYPDGVAFAVLLMNTAVPTIDYYTQPRVFGQNNE